MDKNKMQSQESKKSLEQKCLFCDMDIIADGLLNETDNFYLRVAAKGGIAPGHVMIISKYHHSCFAEMPSCLDEEYFRLIRETAKRIETAFSTPLIFEQGIHGQSIDHAHTHFIPDVSEWYDFTKEKSFVDFIPPEIKVTQSSDVDSLSLIRRIFDEEGKYVSIEEYGRLYVCHIKEYEEKTKQTIRPGRDFPAALTGNTYLLHWQTMPDSEKKKNEEWIKTTIQKLKVK